ncbi:MAG: hypothetical protein FWC03_08410 [Treponema sp.]|nr:hypothetical protein [Treponema sp.]
MIDTLKMGKNDAEIQSDMMDGSIKESREFRKGSVLLFIRERFKGNIILQYNLRFI